MSVISNNGSRLCLRKTPWQLDEEAKECNVCASWFNWVNRKHHCRCCGLVICNNCSRSRFELVKGRQERICDGCISNWIEEEFSSHITLHENVIREDDTVYHFSPNRAKDDIASNTNLINDDMHKFYENEFINYLDTMENASESKLIEMLNSKSEIIKELQDKYEAIKTEYESCKTQSENLVKQVKVDIADFERRKNDEIQNLVNEMELLKNSNIVSHDKLQSTLDLSVKGNKKNPMQNLNDKDRVVLSNLNSLKNEENKDLNVEEGGIPSSETKISIGSLIVDGNVASLLQKKVSIPQETVEKNENVKEKISSEKFFKYDKMKKLGMPEGSIRHKMIQDKIELNEIDHYFSVALRSNENAPLSSEFHTPLLNRSSQSKLTTPLPPLSVSNTPLKGVKFKALYWKPVFHPKIDIENTIWGNFDSDEIFETINCNDLNSLFGIDEKEAHIKGKCSTPTSSNVALIKLLDDAKRVQNITIALKSLKQRGFEQEKILLGIEMMDDNIINGEMARNILNMAPTTEETQLILSFHGDRTKLDTTDQFLVDLVNLPRYENRLKSIIIMSQFDSECKTLSINLDLYLKCVDALCVSKSWIILLKVVLAIGNLLNMGSTRGNAVGFSLDSLLKLSDVKDNSENKTTLMHFIAEEFSKMKTESSFVEDLNDVHAASRLTLPQLKSDFNAIKRNVMLINEEINKSRQSISESRNVIFIEKCEPFILNKGNVMLKELDSKLIKFSKDYGNLVVKYNETLSSMPPDVFFTTVSKFIESFQESIIHNKKLKAKEEKGEVSSMKRMIPLSPSLIQNIDSSSIVASKSKFKIKRRRSKGNMEDIARKLGNEKLIDSVTICKGS